MSFLSRRDDDLPVTNLGSIKRINSTSPILAIKTSQSADDDAGAAAFLGCRVIAAIVCERAGASFSL